MVYKMKQSCLNHPSKESYAICYACKNHYCFDCLKEGLQHYYCEKYECQEQYRKEKDFRDNPRFCDECLDATINETANSMFTFNFIGTTLRGKNNFCSICGSFISSKYFIFYGIPIIKLGTYRIIEIQKEFLGSKNKLTFLSRRIKK